MRVVTRLSEIADASGGVLVPTMGALHAGHSALIRHAAAVAAGSGARCVVSIFVNPTQFNDPADYQRYPRTLDDDLETCSGAGASVVFVPRAGDMYPPGERVESPALPRVATEPGLEDAHRPGHFAGVCQVVLRLFRLLTPTAAVFGEKDWQQLRVVMEMTRVLGLRVRIEPYPTVREPDGLAMSSRNRHLSPGERERAASIGRALCEASGEREPLAAENLMRGILKGAGLEVEYAVVRDADTLAAPGLRVPRRVLIAARAGTTRLIDNAPWTPAGPETTVIGTRPGRSGAG